MQRVDLLPEPSPLPTLPAERAMAWALPVAAWCCYGPLGLKYLGWLAATLLALVVLQQRHRWRAALQQPGMAWLLAFCAWLLLSAGWSVAPGHEIRAHAWAYVMPPTALLIAAACPQGLAERALQHFVGASAVVGLALVLHAHGQLDWGLLGSSTVTAEGNQRIMTSILLALGAALACSLVLMRGQSPRSRSGVLLLLAAVACLLGLASQDRRTGMLLLPLLLLALASIATRSWKLRVGLVLLVVAGATTVWTTSDTVRARFAEGETELQAYGPHSAAVTSWGQRARMLELTVAMVRERPLVGHGLGSWRTLLREKSVIGTALWDNSTPHNAYLLAAAQAGLPAALLLATWLLVLLRTAWCVGRVGGPALTVWLSIALCGLASAVLRDSKLALPLLLLAGLAGAVMRPALRDNRGLPRPRP